MYSWPWLDVPEVSHGHEYMTVPPHLRDSRPEHPDHRDNRARDANGHPYDDSAWHPPLHREKQRRLRWNREPREVVEPPPAPDAQLKQRVPQQPRRTQR